MTYQRPDVHTYTRGEIMELMGPVVTSYGPPCECSTAVSPPIVTKATHTISITVTVSEGCDPFQELAYIIPGGSPSAFGMVSRASGTQTSPTTWNFDVPVEFLSYPGGNYEVEVSLLNAESLPIVECTTPIQIVI